MSRHILEESTTETLAAIVVYTDEVLDGRMDRLVRLKELVRSKDIQRWIKALGTVAPEKRDTPQKEIG